MFVFTILLCIFSLVNKDRNILIDLSTDYVSDKLSMNINICLPMHRTMIEVYVRALFVAVENLQPSLYIVMDVLAINRNSHYLLSLNFYQIKMALKVFCQTFSRMVVHHWHAKKERFKKVPTIFHNDDGSYYLSGTVFVCGFVYYYIQNRPEGSFKAHSSNELACTGLDYFIDCGPKSAEKPTAVIDITNIETI